MRTGGNSLNTNYLLISKHKLKPKLLCISYQKNAGIAFILQIA